MKIASLNAELEHLLGMGPQTSGKTAPKREVQQASSRENAYFLMMEQLLNYSRKHQN